MPGLFKASRSSAQQETGGRTCQRDGRGRNDFGNTAPLYNAAASRTAPAGYQVVSAMVRAYVEPPPPNMVLFVFCPNLATGAQQMAMVSGYLYDIPAARLTLF
jgi:hypothetical protein